MTFLHLVSYFFNNFLYFNELRDTCWRFSPHSEYVIWSICTWVIAFTVLKNSLPGKKKHLKFRPTVSPCGPDPKFYSNFCAIFKIFQDCLPASVIIPVFFWKIFYTVFVKIFPFTRIIIKFSRRICKILIR